MHNKVLLTGGSGLLGTELQKLMKNLPLDVYAPSHKELDITKADSFKYKCDIVIHSAAYTDVPRAEVEHEDCFRINTLGTFDLVKNFQDAYFVYISSEYAKNPVNFYSYTKKWGEDLVATHPNHLIIRTLFKPNPFPFEKAFVDQWTCGDYVDVIAPMIMKQIMNWNTGLVMIGTGRKTIYQLALKTRSDVGMISVDDIKGVTLPKDY